MVAEVAVYINTVRIGGSNEKRWLADTPLYPWHGKRSLETPGPQGAISLRNDCIYFGAWALHLTLFAANCIRGVAAPIDAILYQEYSCKPPTIR